jgi:Protein of unknown function (DUF4231)
MSTMKDITVYIVESDRKRERRNLQLKPTMLARDVLSELNLTGFQLTRPEGGAFRFDDDVYAAVTNQQMLFAVKADLETEGMPLPETDSSLRDQPKDSRKPRSSLTQEERYKEDVKDRIRKYTRKSSLYRAMHNILQFIIFAGAATVTIIITIAAIPKWIPALISGVVTIATAASNFYKFGERGRDFYLTAEEIQQEYNWFVTNRGQYKNPDLEKTFQVSPTFGLFMDRIENLMHAHTQRSFALDKPDEDKNKDTTGNRSRPKKQ